jgi:hypothetical protein
MQIRVARLSQRQGDTRGSTREAEQVDRARIEAEPDGCTRLDPIYVEHRSRDDGLEPAATEDQMHDAGLW